MLRDAPGNRFAFSLNWRCEGPSPVREYVLGPCVCSRVGVRSDHPVGNQFIADNRMDAQPVGARQRCNGRKDLCFLAIGMCHREHDQFDAFCSAVFDEAFEPNCGRLMLANDERGELCDRGLLNRRPKGEKTRAGQFFAENFAQGSACQSE